MPEGKKSMPQFHIRTATPEDIPGVMALQLENQRLHPQAEVVSADMFLSPSYEGGKNVICAVDDAGKLAGYVPVYPHLVHDAGVPHLVWANMMINRDINNPDDLRDLLLKRAMELVKGLTAAVPGHRTRLTFQYHVSEVEAINYVLSKGAAHVDSVMRMTNDLSGEIIPVAIPRGIEIKYWRMETEAEQRAYVDARNEAFPHMPVTLPDWQHILRAVIGDTGTHVAAFDNGELVGCVSVYWDEADNRLRGKAAGWTENVFVREAWRGRGIVDCMISKALLYLKEHGLTEAQLDPGASNKRAMRAYERMGYKVTGESRQYSLYI
jgi:ribosomal protein S18 acetylase RimI-like enzyme